jgi:hypothetical protein
VYHFIEFFSVIVSCPECNKQYKLNPDRVKYVAIPSTDVLGVQLSCSACKTCWWEQKKDLIGDVVEDYQEKNNQSPYQSQKYYDLTDISGLILKNGRSERNLKNDFPQQSVNSFNNSKARFSKNNSVEKNNKKYFFITFICFVIILLIGIGILFIENNKQIIPWEKKGSLLKDENKKIENNEPKDIDVKNITYEVKQSQDLRQVIVIGDITNPNNFDVKVPQIEIIVRGKCDPKDESDGVIDRWNYEWKRQKLTSQESITFKTSRKVDLNFDITNVEIEVK